MGVIKSIHDINSANTKRDSTINAEKPYRLYIYGYDINKLDKDREPTLYFFWDDIQEFETMQQAVDFVAKVDDFGQFLSKTVVFKTLTVQYEKQLPFITLLTTKIKLEMKGKKPMIFPEHDKDIEIKGFLNINKPTARVKVDQSNDNPTGKDLNIAHRDNLNLPEKKVKMINL